MTRRYRYRRLTRATDEVAEQAYLEWFETAFEGWVRRDQLLRVKVIDRLCSSDFGDVYEEWIKAKAEVNPSQNLRQKRDTFATALSASGEISISPRSFVSIVLSAMCFCEEPELYQDREVFRTGKKWTKELLSGVQRLKNTASKFIEPAPPPIVASTDLDRDWVMRDLQRLLGDSILGRALSTVLPPDEPSQLLNLAFDDLDQRLRQHWEDWDKHYYLENARTPDKRLGARPNVALAHLLHRLSQLYQAAGGNLITTWHEHDGHPVSPFAQFLTLIYLALPRAVRKTAAKTPRAFVRHAERLLSDRQAGIRMVPDPAFEMRVAIPSKPGRQADRDE